MQIEQVNSTLREIFNDLINDGHKKSHICSVTLGSSNVPQFDSFIKGNDFGIKPIQRIIENRKFDFKILIVPKNEKEISNFVDKVNNESFEVIKMEMLKILENENSIRNATIPNTGIVAELASSLYEQIIK